MRKALLALASGRKRFSVLEMSQKLSSLWIVVGLPFSHSSAQQSCRYFGKASKSSLAVAARNALSTLPNGLAIFPERTADIP